MIEMAIVIPIVLALGLGTLEFGNLFYKHHLITNGVRDAARFAAGITGPTGIAGEICTNATLQEYAADIAKRTGVNNKVWTDAAVIDVECGPPEDNTDLYYRGGEYIYTVTVTATVPYNSLGFLGYFDLTPPTLSVSHQERVIGVR